MKRKRHEFSFYFVFFLSLFFFSSCPRFSISLFLFLSPSRNNSTQRKDRQLSIHTGGAEVAPTSETTAVPPAAAGAAEGPRTAAGPAWIALASCAAFAPPSSPRKVAETSRTSLEEAGTVGAGVAAGGAVVAGGEGGEGGGGGGEGGGGGGGAGEGGAAVAGGVVVEGGCCGFDSN